MAGKATSGGLPPAVGRSWNQWKTGKWGQFLSRHILKPVLPTPNWITSFDRRPVFQQMPVSPIFGVLCKLFWSIVRIVVKLCKYLSNMWEGRSVSIYLAMNNRSTFENKSVCIATYGRHIKCLSERREKSECERATDCSSCDSWKSWARSLGAWHGTQIRLRIMIGLY